jgi:hypothetical protein
MRKMPTSGPDTARRRRQVIRAIKESLRELSNQLSLLNHHVSAHIDLNDTDLDCLELINRHGPLNPSALGTDGAPVIGPAAMRVLAVVGWPIGGRTRRG